MSTSGLSVTRISRISQYPSVPIVRWCIGDEHPGDLPGAKFTSRLEMDNVPRHPKAANCGSVFGGPMPSHSEYVEMILRAGAGAPRRWPQAARKSTCVPRAATAPNNLMKVIDATVAEERCWFAIEQDSQD